MPFHRGPVRVIPVEILPVGAVRIGLWCSTCNLPSLMEQDWVVIDPRLHETKDRCTTSYCADCGEHAQKPRTARR